MLQTLYQLELLQVLDHGRHKRNSPRGSTKTCRRRRYTQYINLTILIPEVLEV